MINTMLIISSAFYLCVLFFIFLYIKRVSNFYVFFIGAEYFYLLGIGVFPLLLAFGVVELPKTYLNYQDISDISILTPIHIFMYALGAIFGSFIAFRIKGNTNFFISLAKFSYIPPNIFFYFFIFLSFSSFLFFILNYGLSDFVMTSSARRSGSFDYSQDLGGGAFLTRFMILALFIIAVYPYYTAIKKNVFFVGGLISLVGIIAYLSTLSRAAIIQTVLMVFLIYWSYNKLKFSSNLILLLSLFLGWNIFVYGKAFLNYYFGSLANESYELVGYDFQGVLYQFGHLIFSIDSGIKDYFQNNTIATDIFLAPFGILPSSFLSNIGLGDLSYQLLSSSQKSACINSYNIGLYDCTIPAYYTGISAYFIPLIGGFLAGAFRFWIYFSVAKAWRFLSDKSIVALPTLLIIFISLEQLMLFIPSVISLVFFLWILILLYKVLYFFIKNKPLTISE